MSPLSVEHCTARQVRVSPIETLKSAMCRDEPVPQMADTRINLDRTPSSLPILSTSQPAYLTDCLSV